MKFINILFVISILISCNNSKKKIDAINKKEENEIISNKALERRHSLTNGGEYLKSDLIGMWWTPHFAYRKIYFLKNNKFKLNDGDDNFQYGNYTFSNKKVTLIFNPKQDNIVLELDGGYDEYSYTLIGDGENFVKEWEK